MKIKILLHFCFVLVSMFSINESYGQQVQNRNSYNEFVFIHTDRSYFLTGEPVFFKAYILEEVNNLSHPVIDTLYVALLDQKGIEVTSRIFPVISSQVAGYIEIPDFLSVGNYVLIASPRLTEYLVPEKVFSRVVEMRKSIESDVFTSLTLPDTIYESGSLLNAYIRFQGKDNQPKPASFTYQLMGVSGQILSGKNKADIKGMATLSLQLPEFDNKEKLILTVNPKGSNDITALVIPTQFNYSNIKTDEGRPVSANELNFMNIKIETAKLEYKQNENVQLDISVTDNEGTPLIANLSIAASDIIPLSYPDFSVTWNKVLDSMRDAPPETDNILITDDTMLKSIFNNEIRNFFSQCLVMITMLPGNQFIVQEKNNHKKLLRNAENVNKGVQEGYSSDRNIFDILMQIKPYHLLNGNKIVFGMTNAMSINNLEGAIIVVDGIKMGTDANILNTIPVPDIARITASTNVMDIQKYTAMNSVGVIEIYMKKTKEFLEIKEAEDQKKSSTLYWTPEIITDKSGKASINFINNNKSDGVIISVEGIGANGLYGSSSIHYSVK